MYLHHALSIFYLVFDARNSALSLDQRVCLPSNTTSYNIYNTTLKLSPNRSRYGYYCTNVSLNDGLACFMNETDKTVMYFNAELIAGNGSGAVEVNFTLTGGTLRAAFTIVYGSLILSVIVANYIISKLLKLSFLKNIISKILLPTGVDF